METTSARAGSRRECQKQKQVNVGETERKASVAAGSALALSGVTALTKRRFLPGLAMMVAGGLMLYRGKTGHCDVYEALGVDTVEESSDAGLCIEKVLTINRPRQQVYEFWHDLENLPRFMQHLESVQVTGEKTSHWKARGPGGLTVEWDAVMMDDYPEQQIGWHSVGEPDLPNKGTVEFKTAPGDRGTEVKVSIYYYPPGGAAGRAAAKVAHAVNAQQLEEDLKRLKQILETGEIATAKTAMN